MTYRSVEGRLAALETAQEAVDEAQDGYAPDSWTGLAPWALTVHDLGGWEAGIAAVKGGTFPQDGQASSHRLWDVLVFWQKGDTRRFLSRKTEQLALWVIAFCVADLLGQGMPRAEVKHWRTGRMVWDVVVQAVEEASYAE
jgi:hypothetical protein